jgi:hypothetical protein
VKTIHADSVKVEKDSTETQPPATHPPLEFEEGTVAGENPHQNYERTRAVIGFM